MKAFLSILTCILLAALIGSISYMNNYVVYNTFIGTTIIQLMGTIFAIDIGILTILYYEFRKIEAKIGANEDLKKAKSEVKVNAATMTVFVVIGIILSIVKGILENTIWDYILSSGILALQFMTIFMVYDTVDGILSLNNIQD